MGKIIITVLIRADNISCHHSQVNIYLLMAMALSFSLHFMILYVDVFNVSIQCWKYFLVQSE